MIGPFQRLPGSSDGWSDATGGAWLLPISDGPEPAVQPRGETDGVALAVRQAARPLFLAANGLCLALALLLAAQTTTGFMSPGAPSVSAVQTTAPTLKPVLASVDPT